MNLSQRALKRELGFAIEVAKSAGEILLKYEKRPGSLHITNKKHLGVASTADLKSEAFIHKKILERFPGHLILSEEKAYYEGEDQFEKYKNFPFTWIVDPLDGTNNFLNGFNYYSVCISLCHFGNPVLGVVHRPSTGETFSAYKGGGAKLSHGESGKRPRELYFLLNKKDLECSILVTGFYNEQIRAIEDEFFCYQKMVKVSRAIRRLGSAALDVCYVASGMFDGVWERGLFPWDLAAPGIIALEAGVLVSDFQGKEFSPFQGDILAARKPMHQKLKKIIKQMGNSQNRRSPS